MGWILSPTHVIAKICTYFCYVRFTALIVFVGRMICPKTGATHYHAQLEFSDKGCAIKAFGCLQWLKLIAFEPAKQPGPRLLSTAFLV